MPFTPFHLGPGLALKGLARPVFSWCAFAASQVLIDCETLYYLLRQQYPVHRFFHSFLGATAAGLAAAGLWLLIARVVTVALPDLMVSLTRSTSPVRSEFSFPAVFLGGLVGGISHPFLDGIMHPDVRPFMPFSNNDPFLGLIGVGTLHVACLLAAVLGAVGLTHKNQTKNIAP